MTDQPIVVDPSPAAQPSSTTPPPALSALSIRELVGELARLETQQRHSGQGGRRVVRDQALVVRELRRRRARLRAQLTQNGTREGLTRSG
jgi:hypothetical protein